MKYSLLLALAFVFSSPALKAQEMSCSTPPPIGVPLSVATFQQLEDINLVPWVDIGVAFHIVGNSQQQHGLDPVHLGTIITNLNSAYSSAKIRFFELSRDFIWSDYFDNGLWTDEKSDELSGQNRNSNSINMYFVDQYRGAGEGTLPEIMLAYEREQGTTQREEQSVIIMNVYADSSTVPHEVGHYLGLLHTFDCSYGVSCPDGSNDPDTTGDLVADTPAEYGPPGKPEIMTLNFNPSYQYLGPQSVPANPTSTCQGARYDSLSLSRVNAHNMMSYAPKQCRTRFTEGQIARLRTFLDTYRSDELLHHWVTFTNKISGANVGGSLLIDAATTVNSGASLTFNDSYAHQVKTLNERFTNNKHHDWNVISSSFLLSASFTPPTDPIRSSQDANFVSLNPSTLENSLNGGVVTGVNGGYIGFSDPWYVSDANGSQPGTAINITSGNSPTGAYNQFTGGIFLGQSGPPSWNSPYYTLTAPLVQSINSNAAFFSGWTCVPAGSVEFENASNPVTKVKFVSAGSTVVANYSSSTVTYSTTIPSSTWTMSGTLTVPAGVTLTVSSGATLKFPSGTGLTINGTLNANGATFKSTSGTWSGIRYYASSNGNLQSCTINNASYGVYGDSYQPTIQYCTITNNGYGIYLNNTGISANGISYNNISSNTNDGMYIYGSESRSVDHNTISSNGHDGIYCSQGAKPYLSYNKIQNNSNKGVECVGFSPAQFQAFYGEPGHNVITASGYPPPVHLNVTASNSSNVYFGYNGLNSDYGTSIYYIYASSWSSVYAEWNWWGQYPAPSYKFGTDSYATIDYSNALPSDPNSGMMSIRSGSSLAQSATSDSGLSVGLMPSQWTPSTQSQVDASDTSFFDSDLRSALGNLASRKYDDAIAQYQTRLDKESNIRTKEYVLVQLAECYRSAGRKDFPDFLDKSVKVAASKNSHVLATALQLKALSLTQQGDYAGAATQYEELEASFGKDTVFEKGALFNLGYLNFWWLKDREKAKQYFSELASKYPDDDLTYHGKTLLGELQASSDAFGENGKLEKQFLDEKPLTNALVGNYPNPFNPTTQINYQVSAPANVSLKVYDMLGRLVETLVDGPMDAGYHSAVFDGSGLASGVYFTRFTAKPSDGSKPFIQTRKILLAK